ncbi:hypothetical protein VNO77_30808 [Canavalia gladiata]|uniref:Uncharacterized protein n=1 Tax=Canavalia gladiata TaxID=3824 RepID=A0AAN9KNR6_CANGL
MQWGVSTIGPDALLWGRTWIPLTLPSAYRVDPSSAMSMTSPPPNRSISLHDRREPTVMLRPNIPHCLMTLKASSKPGEPWLVSIRARVEWGLCSRRSSFDLSPKPTRRADPLDGVLAEMQPQLQLAVTWLQRRETYPDELYWARLLGLKSQITMCKATSRTILRDESRDMESLWTSLDTLSYLASNVLPRSNVVFMLKLPEGVMGEIPEQSISERRSLTCKQSIEDRKIEIKRSEHLLAYGGDEQESLRNVSDHRGRFLSEL